MKVVKREPKPGEYVLAGKIPERAYVSKVRYVKDGYVVVEGSGYPHDLENVWVLEE